MGPSNRLHVRWQNLLLPGLILAMIAMALFLVISVNASAPSAPNAACTQIFDPRDIPSPKITTFDTLTDGTSLSTQYKTGYGVVFPIQNPAPVIHAVNSADPDTAKTPPNVARNVLLPGVPRAKLEIGFTFPRTYVGFYLGNGMAATGGPVIASIDVLDGNDVSICSFRI